MKIGITERGDAGLDLAWSKRMAKVDFAIIITKNTGAEGFVDELIKHKEKSILHATVTGYGGTVVEPNVPSAADSLKTIERLIDVGFPVEQIVLRVDPIIPTRAGLLRVKKVLDMFKDVGIRRCRISICDIYPHVKERFLVNDLASPYETFTAPQHMVDDLLLLLEEYKEMYDFEACAEKLPFAQGCISRKDMDILKIADIADEENTFKQRYSCLCMAGKIEILNSKVKRCPHGCLYCYWKD